MKPYFNQKKESTPLPVLNMPPRKFLDSETPTTVKETRSHQVSLAEDSSEWSSLESLSENEFPLKKKDDDKNHNLDPYCMAIRKSFDEISKEKQLAAMIHICKKLTEFKISHQNK